MKMREKMTKMTFKQRLASLIPTKRRLIQLYAALLTNANIKGFFTGQIYQGPLKAVCTPGLNCYSCPGAAGVCPLGALQNALASSGKRVPAYIFGIIILYGILLGRWICGFLCPFGLVQELLHKIKTPKIKKSSATRVLSYLKYVILALFTIFLPLIYAFRNFPLPAFCKYICPAGTLEGAIGMLLGGQNNDLLPMLGSLFTWKFALLMAVVVGSIFMFRFFCRFLCPLGALYGLFNKISLLGVRLDKPKCTECGKCHAKCQMDIRHVGDAECISCGECMSVCPTGAITWKGSKFVLPPNEIADKPAAPDLTHKYAKRRKVLSIMAAVLMSAALIGALVYYNFIYQAPEIPDGNEVGNVCLDQTVNLLDQTGITEQTFTVSQNAGKVTVINFWGTWCAPCIEELPYFDAVANEYADEASVIAMHTLYESETADEYIAEHYPDTLMLFGLDANDYYTALGGTGTYPMTVVVNGEGIITAKFQGPVTHEELVAAIEDALTN